MLTLSHKNSLLGSIVGRLIHSSDVTNDWKLDYNLSMVIKYIERASQEGPIFETLKRAEWYLNRACSKAQLAHKKMLNIQHLPLESLRHSPEEVCEGWDLTDHLSSTLINIFFSRGHQSHLLKIQALNAALECLKEEIVLIKKKQNCKISFTKLGNLIKKQ